MPRYNSVFAMSQVQAAMAILFPVSNGRRFADYPPIDAVKNRLGAANLQGAALQDYMTDSPTLLAQNPNGNCFDFTILTWVPVDGSFYTCDFFKGMSNTYPIDKKFAFVLMHDGYLRIGGAHPKIASCKDALFAGEVIFNQGRVVGWSAASGTYMQYAPEISINHAMGIVPFPTSKYHNLAFGDSI